MIASPNHSPRGNAKVRLIIIHTAEGARTVESLGAYFAKAATQASSHVGIDDHRIEQYVDYSQQSWTTRSANPISENAEVCGFAAWSRDEWLNNHRRMLELTAQWIRERCQAHGIPIRKLTPAQVKAGEAGVCGHVDWTLGMKDGTHTDPGAGWPWDTVLGMAVTGGPSPAPQVPAAALDAPTLAAVMGSRPGVPYDRYLAPFIEGMRAADITTVNRAAMWCAQLGTESGGLQWMRELASGAEYEGRADLGNTQKGDGVRYAGRGPIQLTGRANYGAFSRWAASKGYVSSPTYFVDNPTLLEDPKWGFLAASYYWTVARPDINAYADKGDVVTVTRRINGGTNGLADRQARYVRALTFGARLLPPEDDMNADQDARLTRVETMLRMIWEQLAGGGADPFTPDKMFTGWECDDKVKRTFVDIGREGLKRTGDAA